MSCVKLIGKKAESYFCKFLCMFMIFFFFYMTEASFALV